MNVLDITLSSVLSRFDVDEYDEVITDNLPEVRVGSFEILNQKNSGGGPKKSVGRLPLETTEALHEWFSGVVSRPREKKIGFAWAA